MWEGFGSPIFLLLFAEKPPQLNTKLTNNLKNKIIYDINNYIDILETIPDDHLRNHGLLISDNGISLSPVYDINPIPYGDRLSLNISMDDNKIDVDNLFKTYMFYNLSKEDAIKYYNEIVHIVNSNYKKLAQKYNISNSSIEMMKTAFSLKEYS